MLSSLVLFSDPRARQSKSCWSAILHPNILTWIMADSIVTHRPFALQAEFDKAAEEAKTLPSSVTNDDKLKLYGLFKQATTGDVEGCESLPHNSPRKSRQSNGWSRACKHNKVVPESMAMSVVSAWMVLRVPLSAQECSLGKVETVLT